MWRYFNALGNCDVMTLMEILTPLKTRNVYAPRGEPPGERPPSPETIVRRHNRPSGAKLGLKVEVLRP